MKVVYQQIYNSYSSCSETEYESVLYSVVVKFSSLAASLAKEAVNSLSVAAAVVTLDGFTTVKSNALTPVCQAAPLTFPYANERNEYAAKCVSVSVR